MAVFMAVTMLQCHRGCKNEGDVPSGGLPDVHRAADVLLLLTHYLLTGKECGDVARAIRSASAQQQ
jgi:hypothetical protein